MQITKEWLEQQNDLYLTELAATILRIKANREMRLMRVAPKAKIKVYT